MTEEGPGEIFERIVYSIDLCDPDQTDDEGDIELLEMDGKVVLDLKGVNKELFIATLLETQLGVENGGAEYNRQVELQEDAENLEILFEGTEVSFKVKIVESQLEFCDLDDKPLDFSIVKKMIEDIGVTQTA